MTDSDQMLLDTFRSALPASHNREMWVNETYLEFNRLRLLRDLGVEMAPAQGSLMAMLLSMAGKSPISCNAEMALDAYRRSFGHNPTYCWTVSILDLAERPAASCTSPGTAWIGGDV